MMKKSLICLALAASVAFVNVQAQEQTGGVDSSNSADGGLKTSAIAAGYVATAIVVGLVANSNGSSPARPVVIVDPPLTCNDDEVLVNGACISNTATITGTTSVTNTGSVTITTPPPLSCNGDDELVDGVCINNTVTVTVSGTANITVPVTVTYAPSN